MSDEAASRIVRQALVSPVTAFAMLGGLLAAGAGAGITYMSLQSSIDRLAERVVLLDARDTRREQDVGNIRNDLSARMGGIEKSIAGIETSLRYLAEAQRRRPVD